MFTRIPDQFIVGRCEVFIHSYPLVCQILSVSKHFVFEFPRLAAYDDLTSLAHRGRSGPVSCFQILLPGGGTDQVCEDLAALPCAVVGCLPGFLLHVVHPQVPSAIVLLLVILVTENSQCSLLLL